MSKASEIKEILKSIVSPKWESGSGNLFFTAEVKKVDDETCDVEIGDFTLEGVHLAAASDGNANNFIIKPKVGSIVLVCDKTGGSLTWLNVVAFSEIANITGVIAEDVELQIKGDTKLKCDGSIELNEGKNDGLVRIRKLEENLDQLKKYCEALKTATSAGISAVGDGDFALGTVGSNTFNGSMASSAIKFEDMENKDITH